MPQSQPYARVVLWLLLAATFLVPLVFWQGVFFPHTFFRTILFRTLVESALVVYIPLAVSVPVYRPRSSWVLWALAAFIAVYALASFAGVDPIQSIWSDYERMFGLWTQLHLLAYFVMLAGVAWKKSDWALLSGAAVSSSMIVALYALVQQVVPPDRVASTIGNASFLGSFLMLMFFLTTWFGTLLDFSRTHTKWVWGGVGLSLLVVTGALLQSESRGAFLGLTAGIIAATLFFIIWSDSAGTTVRISNRKLKRVLLGLVVVGLVGFSLAVVFRRPLGPFLPAQVDRVLELDFSGRTAQGRFLAWGVAWEGWKDRFIFGWGPENFNLLFDRYYDARLYEQEPWFDRAHNIIFDIGSTTGVLGLAAYALFLAAMILELARLRSTHTISLGAAVSLAAFVAAYVVQNLFTFDTLNSALLLLLVAAFIAGRHKMPNLPASASSRRLAAAASILFVAMIPIWYVLNGAPLLENIWGHRGWDTFAEGRNDPEAMRQIERALQYHTHGDIDVRRFVAEYVFEFLKQGGKRPKESLQRLLDYAIQKMDENIAADPKNVKWLMYQGELYSLAASLLDPRYARQAEELFTRSKEISPERPQIYLELAQARKLQGNIAGLWAALDEGLAILPDYAAVHVNAAFHAIDLGDQEREKIEEKWLFEHKAGWHEVREAYFKAGRYYDAARWEEYFIEDLLPNPETPRVRLAQEYGYLAQFYSLAGEKEKARAAALEVPKWDPTRAAETETFLRSLE